MLLPERMRGKEGVINTLPIEKLRRYWRRVNLSDRMIKRADALFSF